MNPEQFLQKLGKQKPAGVYLFLGSDSYYRRICRDALLGKALSEENRSDGFTQVDLEETSLAQVIDDACSLSLFSQDRVIWATSAEAALPRRLAAASDEADEEGGSAGSALSLLKEYVKAPTAGTVLVFECSRFDFTGDDKPKIERVAKYYAAVPDVVEFRSFTAEALRTLAQDLLQQHRLKMESRELAFLVDAVGGDAARLATEIEKLSLFVGTGRAVTMDDLRALVPNASQSNIFNLVSALGKRDRAAAFRALDLLVRDGEYLPLALTFLGTQLRLTLAVQEAGLRNAQQIVTHFSKQGVRMWRDRAEQILASAAAFQAEQLRTGLRLIYQADKNLRDVRPDDRTVMEALVVDLTK
jgi:DNA polymerase III subunit delta